MPYRVQISTGGVVQYLDKYGAFTPNAVKARIYTGLGPLKNSLACWDEIHDLQIVEVAYQETGRVLTGEEVLNPVKDKRAKEEAATQARYENEAQLRERAEYERLQKKYGAGGF